MRILDDLPVDDLRLIRAQYLTAERAPLAERELIDEIHQRLAKRGATASGVDALPSSG